MCKDTIFYIFNDVLQVKIARLEDMAFKRFYTFSNESFPLHDIFSSESSVCYTKTVAGSDKYF